MSIPGRTPYFVVDAFADRPFAGNPAAVVPLAAWPADERLRAVAAEFNLSETAFLVPSDEGHRLRWFTPAVEVDLCGHATLAAAAVLAHLGEVGPGRPARFETRSGLLTAHFPGDGSIELDFPERPAAPAGAPPGLLEALGVAAVSVGRSADDYLVEVASESEVRAAAPDFARLAAVPCRGVIVTARSDDAAFDFASRFFAPAAGVNEDPVTGSAHCTLAPFWGGRLGKGELRGYQASARGGSVRVALGGGRVRLGGGAVIVAAGELWV